MTEILVLYYSVGGAVRRMAELVAEGDRIDVVARLASRTFGGYESLQLEIRDAAPSGSHADAAAILAAALPTAPVGAPA